LFSCYTVDPSFYRQAS